VEFRILREGNKANSRITTLDFRKVDFGLFNDLHGGIPRERVLERRGVQESWLIFKDHLIQAQEDSIPMSKNASICSTSSLMIWMKGESAPSAAPQTIKNHEKCLIDQMIVLPLRRTLTGLRNGPRAT